MKLQRSEFGMVVGGLSPCLSKLALNPELSHILFSGGKITTSDGRKALRATFETGLECCIPGTLLNRLLSNSKASEVEISVDGGKAVVKAGRGTAKIDAGSVDKYPPVPVCKPTGSVVQFDFTEELMAAIKFCEPTVSQKETQHRLTYLSINRNNVFSGNPNHYSWAVLDKEYPPFYLIQDGVSILLGFPVSSVGRIQDDILFVSSESLEFIVRLPSGLDYPDMMETFAANEPTVEYNVPAEFLDVIERAALFCGTAYDRTIEFGFKEPKLIEINAKHEGSGQFHEEVDVEPVSGVEGFTPMKVNISPDDLHIALKFAKVFGIKFDPKAPAFRFRDALGKFKQLVATRGEIGSY